VPYLGTGFFGTPFAPTPAVMPYGGYGVPSYGVGYGYGGYGFPTIAAGVPLGTSPFDQAMMRMQRYAQNASRFNLTVEALRSGSGTREATSLANDPSGRATLACLGRQSQARAFQQAPKALALSKSSAGLPHG
jgi:hypothetical protein